MKIEQITFLKHSGQGKNATHIKVIEAFKKSKENGLKYCKKRGWETSINNGILNIKSAAMFGFEMTAIVIK